MGLLCYNSPILHMEETAMKVQVDATKILGQYSDPTRWMNSTLRYVPPVHFPEFLENRLGKPEIMRVWITLDEYYDYRTDTTYPDFEIGTMRYPVEELHYPYDMRLIVPAPSSTRFKDYLTCPLGARVRQSEGGTGQQTPPSLSPGLLRPKLQPTLT